MTQTPNQTNEITCKAHLKSLESLKELKEACQRCENHCNRIYYKDIHGSKQTPEEAKTQEEPVPDDRAIPLSPFFLEDQEEEQKAQEGGPRLFLGEV